MPRSIRKQTGKPSVPVVQSSVLARKEDQKDEIPAALVETEVAKDILEQVICDPERLKELKRWACDEKALIIHTKHITGGYMVPNNQTEVIHHVRNMKVMLARADNRAEAESVVRHLEAAFSSPEWSLFYEWRIHEHVDPRLDLPIVEIAFYICEHNSFNAGILSSLLYDREQLAKELKVPMLPIDPITIRRTVKEVDDYNSRCQFRRWDFANMYEKAEKTSC